MPRRLGISRNGTVVAWHQEVSGTGGGAVMVARLSWYKAEGIVMSSMPV